jgi:Ca2+-binding EF-hand superfamily protein
MKKLVLITVLGLTATVANAEQAASTATESAQPDFNQIDSNQDGAISRQEAGSFAALEVKFDEADANKDGALDADEFSQANTASEAK